MAADQDHDEVTPHEVRWDDVAGRRVRSLRAGRSDAGEPPVVLIPGLGALGYLIDTLHGCSAWTRAALLDVPGFGHHHPRPCAPVLVDIAALAAKWLRSVCGRPVVLFGHSTGAQVALHVASAVSVCYRSAWEATHPTEPLATYIPQNPHQADPDWPFRGIDHVFVRCGPNGPTLPVRNCHRVFDQGATAPSDHYGIAVELGPPIPSK